MPALLRWLAALFLLAIPTRAADLPGPWVELASDGGLDVRSITAPGMACPKVAADGSTLTSSRRGDPDHDFPVQVCNAHASASTRGITVDGLPVPVVPVDIKRIVVIGDTGCRLKGTFTQDCNEQVAIRDLVPAGLDMVLSGHVHDFTSYDFGPSRPAQLIVAEGCDVNDAISHD
jgi:hypothetical protein